ncbi:D-alanyl-D-alanine carboxypeptidase family protein [Manganibacter manganicus]|uniref:D-alanyl-D-alanine carboxypeptidase family protein n=1 Tax=Manganibacter manganicus TaxID=1873176 RepID=UPI003CC98460
MLVVAALIVFVTGCTTTTSPEAVLTVPAAPQKYAAIVVDAHTGQQLFAENATAERYPASLTKMMTLYLLFEALQQGRVTRTTPIPVSAHAASQPPTKLYFKPGQTIDVDTAIHALTVKSANDVAVAVAEYLGGSEENFAARMTAKGRQIGMRNTVFRNASGLPDPAQHTTARDMALLGMALRKHFPQYYSYFSATEFVFRGKRIRGHNRMLKKVAGVDGIKTGYTRASGFNIATSYNAGGRSLVLVVMGADSSRKREAHCQALLQRVLGKSLDDTRLVYADQPAL